MPRFSVKSLLIATTLIAIGAGMVCILLRNGDRDSETLTGLLWFGGGALIGAGLFVPFKRPWFGAVFGVAVQGILLYLMVIDVLSI